MTIDCSTMTEICSRGQLCLSRIGHWSYNSVTIVPRLPNPIVTNGWELPVAVGIADCWLAVVVVISGLGEIHSEIITIRVRFGV